MARPRRCHGDGCIYVLNTRKLHDYTLARTQPDRSNSELRHVFQSEHYQIEYFSCAASEVFDEHTVTIFINL